MTKKIFALILIIAVNLSAKNNIDKYSDAVDLFNNRKFAAAFEIFSNLKKDNSIDQLTRSHSNYYAGECLLNLGELDGAAIEFEEFVANNKFSNFYESALYKLGTIYLSKSEYRKARERLLFLVNNFSKSEFNGSANYWIAEAFRYEGKFFEAEEYFNQAIDARTTNNFIVNSLYSLGQLHEAQNEFSKASQAYEEILAYYKTDPLAPRAQWRIGICFFNLKEFDNAVLELTDPLLKQLSFDEQLIANYFLANSFAQLREYKNALEIYDEILNRELNDDFRHKINYSKAWVNFQIGNYDKAFEAFDEISKYSNDTLAVNSLFWSGESKRYLAEDEAANNIFKEFVEKYPDHQLASRAQLSLGSIFYGSENSPDAEKALLKAAVSNNPATKGKANTLLGEMRLNNKQYQQARNYFTSAVKFTTGSKELYYRALLGLSISEFYLNNYDESVKNLLTLKNNSGNFEQGKVNFYLAENFLIKGEYSAALKHYNMIESEDANLRKQALYGKAYSHFNLKDFPNAIYYFNDYIAKYKNDATLNDAKLRLADSYFGIKNFSRASAIYSELFSANKSFADNDLTYYQYCQSLYKAGKAEEAIQQFKNLQQKFPRSKYADVSQYVVGWIYFQQSDYASAINNYNKLIQKYPSSSLIPIAYYSLGDSYFNQGLYDSSIVQYNRILEEYPHTSYILDAVNGIQYAYVAMDNADAAVSFIDEYISKNPNGKFSDQIYFKKGDILYSAENYEGAINAFRNFINNYQSSEFIPNAYYWIGKSEANLKKYSEAVQDFSIVTSKWIKNDIGLSATIELSNIYSEQKNYSAALEILDKATAAAPTSNRIAELLFLKGVAQIKNNQLQNSYETFDQIIKYYPASVFSAKAKIELGILELNRGNYDNAQLLFKELGEKRTDDIGAQAQYYYGLSFFQQKKFEDAISAFVRVRSVFSGFDEWYSKSLLKLGDCYFELKDKKQAREMYKAVIERRNSGDLFHEAKRKLNQL